MSCMFKSEFQSSFQTISSFSIPYVSLISGGLKDGKTIFIQGAVPSGCESFVVNLKCGESEGDDIAFQIKPQFSINCIVLNSRQNGSWGKEEKVELALKQGSSFDLIIVINSENYQTLPYVGPISGGLREGMALYLQGVVPTNAEWFAINFKTGQSDSDETAFHFNPRMDQKVAMNSFRNGGWEAEESISDNPFKKGQDFEMFTVIKSEGYEVYVNGKEQYTFKHRIPLEKVTTLHINGNVVVKLFGFIQNWGPSSFSTEVTTITSLSRPRRELSTIQSEILQPVQNPTLPYVGQISGGLKEGMALYLQGVIPTNADRFALNFKTGQSENDDIAFHFNPRMDQKVAMNSFRNGGWEAEESISDNPFKKGQAFEMFTVIKSEGYEVYVNGKQQYTFKHRIPLEKVTTLNINGNVVVNLFGFIQTLPYVDHISGGLKEGMALYLQGVIPTNADRFALNFKTGQSENDDIAFHFNPRMDQKVSMNSFRNGGWETEESFIDSPFKKGEAFEMFTVIKPEGYQVYVNGKEQYTFKHRIPLEKVTTLNISGDVAVNLLGFIKNWDTSSFPAEVTTTTSLSRPRRELSSIQSEILQPVQNPNLPYEGQISGGLREGMALYLQGIIPTNADRFALNFKTGQSENDDIAFHFNPRMDQKVSMNSFRNKGWETEESITDSPFKKGEAFEMFTVIKPKGYQVYVNGKEQYTFKHRIPLEKVTTLNISGDVAVNLLGFIQNWSASPFVTKVKSKPAHLGSPCEKRSTVHLDILQPVQNPTLPYVGPISGGLREGMALYLQGVIPTNAEWFSINFKTGQSDSDETAFHFNPRMDQKVAMNSFRNGGWEAEESISDNPFKKGQAFEMFTVIKSKGYKVYVNGKEQYTFKHRIPLEKVTTLNINGNVVVNLFGFIENWSASPFVTKVKSKPAHLGSPCEKRSTVHLDILQPVQNPTLPYVGPISGGLREGMALYLQGVIPTNAEWFSINFKTGQSDSDETAFHFNPRMDQKVAMNSFRNGGWEAEESISDNPFKKGQAFEMFTVIKSKGYKVYVNGKEQYTFKHRIPLEKVTTLNINGNVVVNLFGFIENWGKSSFSTEVTTITSLSRPRRDLSTIQSEIFQPVQNPTLPYVDQISGGLKEGMALYLQGVIPTNADRFALNFKTGQSENDDIAFHFNPRMDQKVSMNSFRNGGWETEESFIDSPFKKGEAFEMFTVIKPEGYQVYVNGKEQYTFKHRIPLEKVTTLNIRGDVAVNLLGFIKNLPYEGQISGGLRKGMALYLQGVIPTNADRFALNFKTGQSENDDIAFHFNPRMDQKVSMNSFRNKEWETEESITDSPFKKGEAFEMFTVIKPEGYQVYVNGKEQYTFKHRIPLEKVTTLNIRGDVAVNLLGFIKTLPYVGPISGGLREGMALYLQGVVPTNAEWFQINFKTGQSNNDDIAFQFNPRMDQKVVMNSFRNGGWEAEESVSDNPFKKGEAFDMFTLIKSEGYQVFVNGKKLYTFKQRIPFEKVSALNISGDVAVILSGFIKNWSTSSLVTSKITSLGSSHGEISTVHSEILQPIQNPSLPYMGHISGGLKEGMALYLQGVVPTNADQFEINFKTGQSNNDDIAFHFKPRMNQKVVMNSFRNGGWEAEESVSDNPFKKGEAFDMFTFIRSEGYQVYVNGIKLYTFKHRIPLEKVSALNICGDVAVILSGFIKNWSTSSLVTSKITSLGSSHGEISTIHSEILQPVQNPSLPYMGHISGGLKEGMALYLQGVVPTNADQFEINFKTGQSNSDDIAFHFKPRMNQKVVMNSFRNGGWEAEESVSDNPFKKGEAFDMFTFIRSEGYQVYVNGIKLYTFKHRIPLEKVSALNICGDFAVILSGFIKNWSTSSLVTSKITSLGSSHGELSTIHSEILQPVQNPSLPYVGHISGGLREGMALYLKGAVPTNANKFELNFKTGKSNNDDIAFHFNPRMDKKVAMNSFRNRKWESEESVSDNPFKKGQAFEMFIVIKSEGYVVYVNGKEQYTFKHRIPLEKVSMLNINGDVFVNLFGFIQNWSKSSFITKIRSRTAHLGSSRWDLSTIQSEVLQPVQNPTIPYVGPISGGLRDGMALYLQGVVPTNANQFRMNFKTGPTDKHDIAFHFNPRMGSKVAMNSFRNGKWETEEGFSDNPFKKGEDFEMFLVIKSDGYQVYVNDKEQYIFKHRIPLEKVTTLNINGDVAVNLFGFIQNWSKSSFITAVKSKTLHLGSPRGELSTIKSEVLQPIQNPTLPYVAPIPEGLRKDMALYVQGVVPTNADRFSINFKTGPTGKDDIAFHFNPRMGSKVVMNTFSNGKWGAEECVSDNPFKKGEAFEMFFVIKSEGYQVRIKGQQYSMFKHRIPLEKVTTINIYGNVSISFLGFVMGM
ncbi:hypothetical protein Q8A67_012165 [Cirrhinus molitorella]|uniref:Galectin domain-containing protein n=1 Tax=Cirrhinus molitorella TaxID=172907 RepID=A0AA88TQE1_9TELE|nr:hypothetical protein Q8A67_012165 [Cirrhinus molitorella]